ncbi:MAG: hypothetical protein ACOYT8_00975 [Candidatus Dependentiae bacterium]
MKRLIIIILLFYQFLESSDVPSKQFIDVINHSNQQLVMNHLISEYTTAAIEITKLEKTSQNNYQIIALPQNFLTTFYDNGCFNNVLNNKGQIAGYVYDKNAEFSFFDHQVKNHDTIAAIWDLHRGLILSNLKQSRAAAINDNEVVLLKSNVVSVWHPKTNDFEKINLPGDFKDKNFFGFTPPLAFSDYIFAKNKNGNKLQIKDNSSLNQQLFISKSGRLRLIAFAYNLKVDKTKLRTAMSSVNAQINDNDEVVVLLEDNGKHLIGKWSETLSFTSVFLEDIPVFNGYTSFQILGFNTLGQILLMAIPANLNSRKPGLYIMKCLN